MLIEAKHLCISLALLANLRLGPSVAPVPGPNAPAEKDCHQCDNAHMPERWKCGTCGDEHEGIPFSFAAGFPDEYANMSHDERERRALISSDQCIVDEQRFYVRGCLEIPIIGEAEPWIWVCGRS